MGKTAIELLTDTRMIELCSFVLQVLGADEDNMGDGCSQKLASAKFLRLLLLILIPCICALILLLVILLTFVGEC